MTHRWRPANQMGGVWRKGEFLMRRGVFFLSSVHPTAAAFLPGRRPSAPSSLHTILLRHALVVLVAVGVRADQLGAGAHDEGLVAGDEIERVGDRVRAPRWKQLAPSPLPPRRPQALPTRLPARTGKACVLAVQGGASPLGGAPTLVAPAAARTPPPAARRRRTPAPS